MSQDRTTKTGGCHCGQIRYEVSGDSQFSVHCYCTDCQKLSGTGHNAACSFHKDNFKLTGELSRYPHSSDSGATVTLHFCPKCSSPIYNTTSSLPNSVLIQVGTLDNSSDFQAQMALYEKSRQPWDTKFENGQVFGAMPPMDND